MPDQPVKNFRLSIGSIGVLWITTCLALLAAYVLPNIVGWVMTIPVYGLLMLSIVLAGMSLVKNIKYARVVKGRKNRIFLLIAVMNVLAAGFVLRFIVTL